jgi:hypothetical protein
MKNSVLIAMAMVAGLGGFAAGAANAGPFIPMTVQSDRGATFIHVGGKKNDFARELSRHLLIGALRSTPQAQEGELAACLDAADAEGLSPKKALRACMETLGTTDDGDGADEEVVSE